MIPNVSRARFDDMIDLKRGLISREIFPEDIFSRCEYEQYFFAGDRHNRRRCAGTGWKVARREIHIHRKVLLVKNLTVFFLAAKFRSAHLARTIVNAPFVIGSGPGYDGPANRASPRVRRRQPCAPAFPSTT